MASAVPWRRKTALERTVQYRNRAEELRLIAEEIAHADCRARVLRTADTYREMAEIAEETLRCR
jgi:hypothetical protein